MPNLTRKKLTTFAALVFLIAGGANYYSEPASSGKKVLQSSEAPQPGVRRALLVGVNDYNSNDQDDTPASPTPCMEANAIISRLTAPHGRVPPTRRTGFQDLRGAINDVAELYCILIARGFKPQDIRVLTNEEATSENIRQTFLSHLVANASRGDFALFYFNGHGSQVLNKKGGESDVRDETIVPYDVVRPVTKKSEIRDLRDKQIAVLFHAANEKGVKVTAIFDSCHSGSIDRGGLVEARAKDDGPTVGDIDVDEEPPEFLKGVKDENEQISKTGALVLSAAQEDQRAFEMIYGDRYRGNFSYALFDVLKSPAAQNLSGAQIYARVMARMNGRNVGHEPYIAGSPERRAQNFFGEEVKTDAHTIAIVEEKVGEEIKLQGGQAVGLHDKSELIRLNSDGNPGGNPVRIIIEGEPNLSHSKARVINAGDGQPIEVGTEFRQVTWTTGLQDRLTVWIPPSRLPQEQLDRTADELRKLKNSPLVQLIEDPTAEIAEYRVEYEAGQWRFFSPGGETSSLGANFTAQAVLSKLPAGSGRASVFVFLPPTSGIAEKITLGDGTKNGAIKLTGNRNEASYFLIGRLAPPVAVSNPATSRTQCPSPPNPAAKPSLFQYAWVAPAATVGSVKTGENIISNARRRKTINQMPPITDWTSAPEKLEHLALTLNKIKDWMEIESPAADSRFQRFPYRLVIRKCRNNILNRGTSAYTECREADLSEANTGAEIKEGEVISFWLKAESTPILRPNDQWFIYVIAIDQSGQSRMVYPRRVQLIDPSRDLFPPNPLSPPPEIYLNDTLSPVCGSTRIERMCENCNKTVPLCDGNDVLGAETYIMLTTSKSLPLTENTLAFCGVRSPDGTRGRENLLSRLLVQIGSTEEITRGVIIPPDWTISRVTFRSVK